MTFRNRQKPITLLLCSGFIGILASSIALDAYAQAPAALRVDPALLGLPPVEAKPQKKTTEEVIAHPLPEKKTSPTQSNNGDEKPSTPVQITPVETTPVESKALIATPVEAEAEKNEPVYQEPLPKLKSQEVTPEPAKKEKVQPTLRQSEEKPVRSQEVAPKPAKELPPPVAPEPVAPPPVSPAPVVPRAATEPVLERKIAPAMPPVKMKRDPREESALIGTLKVDPALLGEAPPRTLAEQTVESAPAPAYPVSTPVEEIETQVATVDKTHSREPVQSRSIEIPEGDLPDRPDAVGVFPGSPVDYDVAGADLGTPSLGLRLSRNMTPLPKESNEPRPVFISSKRMHGVANEEFIAEEEAELRKIGTILTADKLTYWPVDDEVEAEGNARLEQGGDVVSGPKMRMRLEDKFGFIDQASYQIRRESLIGYDAVENQEVINLPQTESFWNSGFVSPSDNFSQVSGGTKRKMTEGVGEADRIDFEGENHVKLTNATYSTCPVGNNDWFIKMGDLHLDYDNEVGSGSDGTLYFMNTPIFYTPKMSFPLNDGRKSGFLAPRFGTNSDSGAEFALPYYWSIAPNLDTTITPNIMSKRGVMFNNEWRYLNQAWGGHYNSNVKIDFLPSDRLYNSKTRYGYAIRHDQNTSNGFTAKLDYNKVSDDDYFTDLTTGVTSTSSTQLLQQAQFGYAGNGWWSATANFQQYQTLQPDPANLVLAPYKLLPQITLNARRPDFYTTDLNFMGQFTRFTQKDQFDKRGNRLNGPNATRTVLYPQLAIPYETPGWYVTPKVGVNMRHYSISNQKDPLTPSSENITLPVLSVDSGMTFERSSNWFGKDYTQTLEPRLYYVYIPYKDQYLIPNFDTGYADFNFAQIFSENQYSGWDKVNNANQLTAAVTSRLIDPNNGEEIMRAMVGQRFYFTQNRVGLENEPLTTSGDKSWEKSDILGAFSGQILPRIFIDTALQYEINEREIKRYSVGGRYQPAPGKVLNAAYRYNRNNDGKVDLNQVDVSGQWPLYKQWHGVGRVNYSFKDDATNSLSSSQSGRILEAIAGLEYNAGCWVIRGVMQRQALTHDKASTSFFIQLELNDFARIGSNPLDLLKRNIQGYRLVNDPSVSTGFDQ